MDKVKYSYATWIKGASGKASLEHAVKFLTDIKMEMKEHGVADLPLGTVLISLTSIYLKPLRKWGLR